ncbi:MAG: T9SS type A sorting domain-containing protein [Calditrichia bacterium]
MLKGLQITLLAGLLLFIPLFAQTNQWMTDYTVFDDNFNGTGYQTSSVAVIGLNRFVALVTETPNSPILDNLFTPPGNYLVGYWDADSGLGRVPSPINGSQTTPAYGTTAQFTDWEYILDQVKLKGAWQIAGDQSGYVYVANNDEEHNILVFELNSGGVESTSYRMATGNANIFGIEVDTAGYVYVVDYEGTDAKTDEVKVYAGIDAEGTTWGEFGGHNDAPVATIDLPVGIYQGITVSGDGTELFISATSERSIWKYVGDPVGGYTKAEDFSFTLSPDDTVSNGGSGTPSVLGLAFQDDFGLVYAAVDTFIAQGLTTGYPYGRIYVVDGGSAASLDTIDIAEWNFARTGAYDSGSNNGRAGGFTSVCDVDVDPEEKSVYTQTYYGWAVEKWIFDGDLAVLDIGQISAQIPEKYNLQQNYPNPFNPVTTIEFAVEKTGLVNLDIFNIRGQKIAGLVNKTLTPGSYKVSFDAGRLPSGVYFYRLTAGTFQQTKRMILMK